MKISVVLPIYNEGNVIKDTINELVKKMPKYVTDFEILAVNDGSTDNTAEVLATIENQNPWLTVLTHSPNQGYGAALQTGIRNAKYNWIFFMDSDLQFDVNDLAKFLPYTINNDFIVGYRVKRADNQRRIMMSHIYNRFVNLLFPLPVRDVDCAFKLMRKSALLQLGRLSDSFFVSSEFMIKAAVNQYAIVELPVRHLPRTVGQSKVTLSQVLRTVRDLGKIYISTLSSRLFAKTRRISIAFNK